MLSNKEVAEIREHLERAQNPVFFYDNDADGLCSFLLLRRYLGRGKGVAIRSYPGLGEQYARRAEELKADYIFVLDKPILDKKFVDEIEKMNLPLIWIDHHDMPNGAEGANLKEYNTSKNQDKKGEPVSYIAYKITNQKRDLWIALMGCIADHYMPDFSSDFEKGYPNYWAKDVKLPFQAYFGTEIGKIARALGFGLKDSISHTVQLQNFLINCNGPDEIFVETHTNSHFRKRYTEIKKRYETLLKKAREKVEGNILFFEYGGDLSISADLANELCYLYPDKYICVSYIKGAIVNISLRGRNVKKVLNNILGKLENASGGGHEDAVGARIMFKDLERFRDEMEKEVGII